MVSQVVLLPSAKKDKKSPTQSSQEPRPPGGSKGAWEGAEARLLARNSGLNTDVVSWGTWAGHSRQWVPQALLLIHFFLCSPFIPSVVCLGAKPFGVRHQHCPSTLPLSFLGPQCLLCARPWAHHCPGLHGPWRGQKWAETWWHVFTESVHIPKSPIVGARTTEMTKLYTACSQFRLAEDISGNSYFQAPTAVRMGTGSGGRVLLIPRGSRLCL